MSVQFSQSSILKNKNRSMTISMPNIHTFYSNKSNIVNIIKNIDRAEELFPLTTTKKRENLINKYCYDDNEVEQSLSNSIYNHNTTLSQNNITIVNKNFHSNKTAIRVMKINKKIYDDVSNINLQKQITSYSEAFRNIKPRLKKPLKLLKRNSNRESRERLGSYKSNSIIIPNSIHDENITMKAYYYNTKLFPESREQFSWCRDGDDCLLFGGLVINRSNSVWSFDLKNFGWEKIVEKEFNYANLRYGHTGVVYDGKLIIFGGRTLQNYYLIPDVEIFRISEKTWRSPILRTHDKLKLRKYHVACMIGNQMFVHGGLSEDDKYLNDAHLLNLSLPIKWQRIKIWASDWPTLAYHTCCLVLPQEIRVHSKFNLYKFPELNDISKYRYTRITEKGVYLFGGKGADEILRNDIWVLRLGCKTLEWFKISTLGKPPEPRIGHSMNYYEDGNYIIVHGGKNDTDAVSGYNDTYLLELRHFNWIRIDIYFDISGMQIFKRWGHGSIIKSQKLIIFGGANGSNYLGSSLFILDLDSKGFFKDNGDKKQESMGNYDKALKKISVFNNLPPIK